MRKKTIEEMDEEDGKADVWMEEQRLGMWDIDITYNKANSATERL
jgi:hypothetical protein